MNRNFNGFNGFLVYFVVFLISATSLSFGDSLTVTHSPLKKQVGFGDWGYDTGNLCIGNWGLELCAQAEIGVKGNFLTVSEQGNATLDRGNGLLFFEGLQGGGTASMEFGATAGVRVWVSGAGYSVDIPIPFLPSIDFMLRDSTSWKPYFPDLSYPNDPISLAANIAELELFCYPGEYYNDTTLDSSIFDIFELEACLKGVLDMSQNLQPISLLTSEGGIADSLDTIPVSLDCGSALTVSQIRKQWNWTGRATATFYLEATVSVIGWEVSERILLTDFVFPLDDYLTTTFETDPVSVYFPGGDFSVPVISGFNHRNYPTYCGGDAESGMTASVTYDDPNHGADVSWSWTASINGNSDFWSPDSSTPTWEAPQSNNYTGPVTITATATKNGCSKSSSVTFNLRNAIVDPLSWLAAGCDFIDVKWQFQPRGEVDVFIFRDDGLSSGALSYEDRVRHTWRDTLPGTSSHSYQIRFYNGCAFTYSGGFTSVSVTGQPPAKPDPISVVPDRDRLVISWNSVPGATEYCVYLDGELFRCWDRTSLTYFASDQEEHCFMVIARNSCGDSQGSETVCASAGSCCIVYRGNIDHGPDDGTLSSIDISDLVFLVDYMFREGPTPLCFDEANVTAGVDQLDIAELVYLVDYMFREGPAPLSCP